MILTANLCCALQKVYKDLVDSFEGIDFIKRTLQNRRSTEEWKDNDYGPYIMAEILANSINVIFRYPELQLVYKVEIMFQQIVLRIILGELFGTLI